MHGMSAVVGCWRKHVAVVVLVEYDLRSGRNVQLPYGGHYYGEQCNGGCLRMNTHGQQLTIIILLLGPTPSA